MEGNVFKMRVFPLEERQEKRVIISFTQELESLYGKLRYALPLENARCEVAYGHPSSINKVLIVNREPFQGRTTVLLVDEAIGF